MMCLSFHSMLAAIGLGSRRLLGVCQPTGELLALCVLGLFFTSCQQQPGSFEAEIKEIHFVKRIDAHSFLVVSDTVVPSTTRQEVNLSSNADLDSLVPIFELSEGARSTLRSGQLCNGRKPLVFTVTSENGKVSREYTFSFELLPTIPTGDGSASRLSAEALLSNFHFVDQEAQFNIRGARIRALVKEDVDLSSLRPAFDISNGASSSFTSGEVFNFAQDNLFIWVTAEDGISRRGYQVSAAHDLPPLSVEAQMWDFRFEGVDAEPVLFGATLIVNVPQGVNVKRLIPRFEISNGATATIESGRPSDFTEPRKLVVRSQDGKAKSTYTVEVVQDKGSEAELSSVTLQELISPANPTGGPVYWDHQKSEIHFLVPNSLPLSTLTLSYVISQGAKASMSNNMPQDLTQPKELVVTSEDGNNVKHYTIVATQGGTTPHADRTIKEFTLDGQLSSEIVGRTISVVMPAGAKLTSVIPTFTLSEAKIGYACKLVLVEGGKDGAEVKSGETAIDVSATSLTLRVRGTKLAVAFYEDYTLRVSTQNTAVPLGVSNVRFQELPGVVPSMSNGKIMFQVAPDVDTKHLTLLFDVPKGVTTNLVSGQSYDFSRSVLLKLTAPDGKSYKTYTFHMEQKLSSEAYLSDFSFKELSQKPTMEGSLIELYLGPEINVKALTPQFTLSRGAKSSMKSGETADFSNQREILVTSEDGNIMRTYTVRVVQELNSEADIKSFVFQGLSVECDITDGAITFPTLPNSVDLKHLVPIFTLSPGAKASISSGEPCDFSGEVTIIVTSQDENNVKYYKVAMERGGLRFDFERWNSYKTGALLYQHPAGPWSSGNAGIETAKRMFGKPAIYPLRPTSDAHGGSLAAVLSTEELGVAGNRTAPGSLFLGSFDGAKVMDDPLSCPKMGIAWSGAKPIRLKGWYKYSPGAEFKDGKGNSLSGADELDIYAVVYRGVPLTPKEGAFNNPRVIGLARVPDRSAKKAWTHFDVAFEYSQPYELTSDLKFSIVCTSSSRGDFGESAVGSTLVVDDLEVTF